MALKQLEICPYLLGELRATLYTTHSELKWIIMQNAKLQNRKYFGLRGRLILLKYATKCTIHEEIN